MNARPKLNSASVIGCVLIAAVAGGVTGSWMVFLISAVVLAALAFHAGDIRLSPRRSHGGHS